MVELPGNLRSSRMFLFGLAVFYIFSIWFISQQYRIPFISNKLGSSNTSKGSASSRLPNTISSVRNATLGFGKVFVVNLKDRTDKLDSITLAASLTGFHLDVIEGVRGVDISAKALPPNKVPENKTDWDLKGFNNIAGCWRSHINFAQRIVSENLGSGLVIEDDADWSVYLKDQLEQMAAGTQYVLGNVSTPGGITNLADTPTSDSPYGSNWDMLWLGHCGSTFAENTRRYVIENDPTVPPPNHIDVNKGPDFAGSGYDNSTRVIYIAGGGLCTQSYALSLRGAQKMLLYHTTNLDFEPIDISLHALCQEKTLDFSCVAPFPPLWSSHRTVGNTNRDSDIMRLGKGTVRKTATTANIVHAMRLNAENILRNGLGAVQSQWDDMPVLEGELRIRKE